MKTADEMFRELGYHLAFEGVGNKCKGAPGLPPCFSAEYTNGIEHIWGRKEIYASTDFCEKRVGTKRRIAWFTPKELIATAKLLEENTGAVLTQNADELFWSLGYDLDPKRNEYVRGDESICVRSWKCVKQIGTLTGESAVVPFESLEVLAVARLLEEMEPAGED